MQKWNVNLNWWQSALALLFLLIIYFAFGERIANAISAGADSITWPAIAVVLFVVLAISGILGKAGSAGKAALWVALVAIAVGLLYHFWYGKKASLVIQVQQERRATEALAEPREQKQLPSKQEGPPRVVVTPVTAEPLPTRYTFTVDSENWYTVEWPSERCYYLTNGKPDTEREDLSIEVRGTNDPKWIDHWEYITRREKMSGWIPGWIRVKAKEGKDGETREQTVSLEFRRIGKCGI